MTATDAYLLLRAFCDELARCGLEHACTSPGSRSTPIVLSLAREPRIRCWSHLDERCAGFFALGAAKASGRPVAVTCTSGTAAANLSPAVIEARWARVPLIVLTADRPAELRDIGAGQTIDQVKLYGDAVKWFFELDVARADEERLRWIRGLACRAYWTALEGTPGPVHLNVPLREPLVLDRPLPEDASGRPAGRPWLASRRVVRVPAQPLPGALADLAPRGVVVAGRDERDPALGDAIARFAARLGYPLLADPLSGARSGPSAVAHYDLLLRDGGFTSRARPEVVIRIGDLPTSKPLRSWLASLADVTQVVFDPDAAWHDPAAVAGVRIAADPAPVLEALAAPERPDADWLAVWRGADEAVAAALEEALGDELSEPLVARAIAASLGPEATLFVASSMPVRDVETFVAAAERGPRVLSNRGTNGIDGTVSSAFGAAAVTDGPVVLLVGDVALAYDIGGLLAGRRLALSLTIVLVNNDGGGIFHFLPVAGEADAFEEHVATPHGLQFEHAAAFYGCGYELVGHPQDLAPALERSTAGGGTTILEIRTDRVENLRLHREVASAAARALAAWLSPPAPAAARRA